jgi:hypothetical protein
MGKRPEFPQTLRQKWSDKRGLLHGDEVFVMESGITKTAEQVDGGEELLIVH